MAEGIFRHIVKDPQYQGRIGKIDSCGTGAYHAGDDPDERTMATLEQNGITGYRHAARKFKNSDLQEFDYVFAMDRSNLSDLRRKTSSGDKAKVMLFGEYSGTGKAEIVNDPYYGGDQGFKTAFEQCSRFARNFLDEVVVKEN